MPWVNDATLSMLIFSSQHAEYFKFEHYCDMSALTVYNIVHSLVLWIGQFFVARLGKQNLWALALLLELSVGGMRLYVF